MNRLIEGYRNFRKELTPADLEDYEKHKEGQKPEFLFITCSDSRVMPGLFTKAQPGMTFQIQTAGNLVPPYGAEPGGGIAATIEYGVSVLGVSHVVVCGHSHCGAMQALFQKESLSEMPVVQQWLENAESTRRLALGRIGGELKGNPTPELVHAAVEANVIAQLDNLRTHPSVAAALYQGTLNLHGWVYHVEKAEVDVFDSETMRFTPLDA